MSNSPTSEGRSPEKSVGEDKPSVGQIALVLQGGGALAAYPLGIYEALHETGIEPDWVIGTSIGAINAALIAGNKAERRMSRLEGFWRRDGCSVGRSGSWRSRGEFRDDRDRPAGVLRAQSMGLRKRNSHRVNWSA